ncbi:glyceraldehyde 3-phosphate dehydrogenase (NAD(P)+) [Roseomonas rosea]|uniref:Glyceraldehyde 3-phosphate dehydrogenase (NAD(P)+) n=2 Tax=Roseomonadaceae TaxID=3385906 RepID=A0A1M6RKL6_9PROT|nr:MULTISPECIES: type II glyceraldehyde-3-phosphate dehydrogenase [Acetobacteraceae]PHK93034.1 type II glyceraldehyde-3-phosphate dehydrogenase [Pseudoroseomonas rhizosphaerae]PZR08360.1 MAG: type II glyceraldehyde-3-phosphate dehydrogenase [Azospirillum brasilense]SHK32976.1 glyceraldehyde 3-phosphate dehydrogenase (NAD(P)+) [Roseomonas rosea]
MANNARIRVGVVGYGVIGKRVAGAVACQEDMELTGIADVLTDWRMRAAARTGFRLYGATPDHAEAMQRVGLPVEGDQEALLGRLDVVVDCTPKHVAVKNVEAYRRRGVKFILQGGEKHETTGHSFVAEANYATAIDRDATRVVSCNTSSAVRTLSALKRAGLLRRARGTLLRRATDPWESHLGGIMNTLVPEAEIPSHQGPDAQTVDPELDVVTVAIKVPETIGHVHSWAVQLTRSASREEVLDAFRTSSRIAFVEARDGLPAPNTIKELTADLGRPHGNLYEVALWSDTLKVLGDELFYLYMVDNQAIVIPETVDAIRALTGRELEARASIARTDAALGITGTLV